MHACRMGVFIYKRVCVRAIQAFPRGEGVKPMKPFSSVALAGESPGGWTPPLAAGFPQTLP